MKSNVFIIAEMSANHCGDFELAKKIISTAKDAGADAVKLFPAGLMGAEYLKAIRGPMPHIPIAAVGNITENNIAAFKNAGACAFGISSGLASAEEINNCRYEDITQNCKRYFGALNA